MKDLHQKEPCSYCAEKEGTEPDHVIARQFFPPAQRWRGLLPQVPSCPECNRKKQGVEDSAAVFFQLAHDSLSSKQVLNDRVPRTLKKNLRLARALREGLQKAWVPSKEGILVERLLLKINDNELNRINQWFQYVFKGLYRYSLDTFLPKDHDLFLIKPRSLDEFTFYQNMINNSPGHVAKSIADDEVKYFFAQNQSEQLSLWLLIFKSIEMFAVIIGPTCPYTLRSRLIDSQWVISAQEHRKTNTGCTLTRSVSRPEPVNRG